MLSMCNSRTRSLTTLLELLCERAKVRGSDLHTNVRSSLRIEDTLLDDVRLVRTPCGA